MATQPGLMRDDVATRELNPRVLVDGTLLLLWAVLSFAAGTSWLGYSRDYFEYLTYYNSIPITFSTLDTRFEPGFHTIAWIFRNWLNVDLSVFVTVITAVSLGIKFTLFRKHLHHPLVAAALYMILFYPAHEYTQFRVGLSLAFGYAAVHMVLDRRFAWAALLFALSFSFHYSSILLLLVAVGGSLIRGRKAAVGIVVLAGIGLVLIEPIRGLIGEVFGSLNPLSQSYLENLAMIEGVSLLSINNLLLVAAIACYIAAGYYTRSRYHALFLTMTIACLVPIALLPDAPVVSQRSKEVLFVAVIFLACRSRLTASDLPGLGFIVAMAGLLGYLTIEGGVIFS